MLVLLESAGGVLCFFLGTNENSEFLFLQCGEVSEGGLRFQNTEVVFVSGLQV